ncbi:hypothetical protein F444_06202 [Phytophthora nicotianae P1976]|uniref:Uncharacterized protein n=1 Tax=Phytophthora nicotianae P1976 TaxID=1317066 RepID=A0A081AJK8_PHYNI|nr:hypothetical protein F444_06202 [Phytophthora nicotianae P1976]
MARKRKRTAATTIPYAYQCVSRKLNQVCGLEFLRKELQRTIIVLRQVGLIGWKIAGVHILRASIRANRFLNSTRCFLPCCAASLGSTEKRDRYKTNPKYPDLNKTFFNVLETLTTASNPRVTVDGSIAVP